MTGRDKLFDAAAPIQVPLTAEGLLAFPARRGVFLLEGDGGAPLMLTTAADIRSRLRFRLCPDDTQKTRRVDLREIARTLRWKLSDSGFETDWHYLELAREIYPDMYRQLVSLDDAWFAHVDLQADFPRLAPARNVFHGPGRWLGPFPSRRWAVSFVEIIQDAFDLCRRECPAGGKGCVYAQMGKCRGACLGRISPAEYRAVVAEAVACAAGEDKAAVPAFEARMRRFAAEQAYEQAAACKLRLQRLAELSKPEFARVAPAEMCQYVLVQRGPGRGKAKTFAFDRGAITPGPLLTYPLAAPQLEAVCALARSAGPAELSDAELGPRRERIALLAKYLFGSPERMGVILPAGPGLTANVLGNAVEALADALHLKREIRKKDSPPSPEGGSGGAT